MKHPEKAATHHDLVIRPFQPADQPAAKALILDGLAGHWGFLDPTLNPDLNHIAVSYAAGVFLTAWLGDRMVGTGAFLPEGYGIYRIVRMSVRAEFRRLGIGSMVLHDLVGRIKALEGHTIILETTSTWCEVIQFYQRFGFTITGEQNGETTFSLAI